MATKPNTGDLLKMLKGISSDLAEQPAEGFHSTNWWANEWGLHPSKARAYIAKGQEAGLVEHRDYFLPSISGRRKVPHYKISQSPIK
jgi:hypothetical protein